MSTEIAEIAEIVEKNIKIKSTGKAIIDAVEVCHRELDCKSTEQKVIIYAYGTADGTSYDGGASGTDGSYSIPTGGSINLALLGTLNIDANSKTDQQTFSIAQAFGGTMPSKWGIVVLNSTGATLDASVGSAWYQGVLAQYT
jgi:hypothetical protein